MGKKEKKNLKIKTLEKLGRDCRLSANLDTTNDLLRFLMLSQIPHDAQLLNI